MNRPVARIWHTLVDPDRVEEYERFAREISLPMFRSQDGLTGLVMMRDGDSCRVLTLWSSREAVAAMESSPAYRSTVAQILAAGFLRGSQCVELFDVHLLHLDDPSGRIEAKRP